jgi:hypothetical protein
VKPLNEKDKILFLKLNERLSEQRDSFHKTGKVRIPEVLDIAYRLIKIINRLLEKEKTN